MPTHEFIFPEDQDQRDRAMSEHGVSLLVEAGAGTGKTSILVGRCVLMLADGINPEEIAAITFTEASAGELQNGISKDIDMLTNMEIHELRAEKEFEKYRSVLPDGLTPIRKENLEQAYEKISHLTITTIHGFCQRIIRPYPVELEIDPGADVMGPPEAETLREECIKDFLNKMLGEGASGGALETYVFEEGTKLLRDFKNQPGKVKNLAEFLLKHPLAKPREKIFSRDAVVEMKNLIDTFRKWLNGQPFQEETTVELAEELEAIAEKFETKLDVEPEGSTLVSLAVTPVPCSALTQEFTWRKWGRKGKWQIAATDAGFSKAEGGRISEEGRELYEDIDPARRRLQEMINVDAFGVLVEEFKGLTDVYSKRKLAQANLDFDDLLIKARHLLRSDGEVRKYLSEKYKHILVDEFQDTDRIQAEIILLLSGDGEVSDISQNPVLRDGELFCVGDPKQAIYRFRGADVDTYENVKKIFERLPDDNVLKITTNFRSGPRILDWVNGIFGTGLKSGKPTASDRSAVVRLPVEVTFEEGEGEGVQYNRRKGEADAVAGLCQDLIKGYGLNGKTDAVKPGEIALLAPSGTDLDIYEDALEEKNISVASQAGKGFFRRQEIQDLIAITRVLADKTDTIAFGALMRGPLIGLTEEEMLDIVDDLSRAVGTHHGTVFRLWSDLSLIKHEVAREAIGVLQNLARHAYSRTPFEILLEAIEVLHLRPNLRHREQSTERILANVDHYLEMARQYDIRGLNKFAIDMRQKWELSEKEIEGRTDEVENSVNLITMHTSKGDQWPIVIPINLVTKITNRNEIVYNHDNFESYGHLGKFGDKINQENLEYERVMEDGERKNLLYVACTRAKELLVIPYSLEDVNKNSWVHVMDLEPEVLDELDRKGFTAAPRKKGRIEPNKQDLETFKEEADGIASLTKNIKWKKPSLHEVRDGGAGPDRADDRLIFGKEASELRIKGGPVRGDILHKLLEEVMTGFISDEPEFLKKRANELIEQLGEEPVEDPSEGLSPNEIAHVALNTLAMPEISSIRDRLVPECPVFHHEVEKEIPPVEEAVSGIVDALVCDDDRNIEIVIDWKSDVRPTEKTRDNYREQVRDYINATGANYGMIVYMTYGEVDKVTAI